MSTTVHCADTNLCHQSGDTLAFNLHVTTDGVDEDITGWIFFLTIKKRATDSDESALIDMTITSHTDAAGGKSLAQVEKEEMAEIEPGVYRYAILALKPDGYEFSVQEGRLTIEKRVRTDLV